MNILYEYMGIWVGRFFDAIRTFLFKNFSKLMIFEDYHISYANMTYIFRLSERNLSTTDLEMRQKTRGIRRFDGESDVGMGKKGETKKELESITFIIRILTGKERKEKKTRYW